MKSMCKLDQAWRFSLPRLGFILAMAGVLLSGTSAAYAQADQERMKSMLQARQHLHQIEQKLTKIQKATISSHPELRKQEDKFKSLLMSTMRDKGFKPQEDMKRLGELRQKLRARGLEPKERNQLIAEFQQKSSRLQQAQQEAFSDKKVQQAQQDLQDAVVAAMKKKDPDTSKLLKEMDETQKKLDQLQSSGD